MDDISLEQWNSDILTTTAFQDAVSASMTGVTSTDIVVTAISGSNSPSRRHLLSSAPYVSVNYTVTFNYAILGYSSPTSAYNSLSTQLSTSIQVGNFTTYLRTYGSILGCTYLSNASSSSVYISAPVVVPDSVNSPTESPIGAASASSSSTLSAGAVAGVVIVLVVALGSLGGVAYYWKVLRKKKSAFAKWDSYYSRYNQSERGSEQSSRSSSFTDSRRGSARRPESLRPESLNLEDEFSRATDQFDFVNVSIDASKREKSKQKIQKLLAQKSVKNLAERATLSSAPSESVDSVDKAHSPFAFNKPVKLASSMRRSSVLQESNAPEKRLSFRISAESSDLYASGSRRFFIPGGSLAQQQQQQQQPSILRRASALLFNTADSSDGGLTTQQSLAEGSSEEVPVRRGSRSFFTTNPIAKTQSSTVPLSNSVPVIPSKKSVDSVGSIDSQYNKSKDTSFSNPIRSTSTPSSRVDPPVRYSGGIFAKTKSTSYNNPIFLSRQSESSNVSSGDKGSVHADSVRYSRDTEYARPKELKFTNPIYRPPGAKASTSASLTSASVPSAATATPMERWAASKPGSPLPPQAMAKDQEEEPQRKKSRSVSSSSSSESENEAPSQKSSKAPKKLPLRLDDTGTALSSIPVQLQSNSPIKMGSSSGEMPSSPGISSVSSTVSSPSFVRSVASAMPTPVPTPVKAPSSSIPNTAGTIGKSRRASKDEDKVREERQGGGDDSSEDSDNNVDEDRKPKGRTFSTSNPLRLGATSSAASSFAATPDPMEGESRQRADQHRNSLLSQYVLPQQPPRSQLEDSRSPRQDVVSSRRSIHVPAPPPPPSSVAPPSESSLAARKVSKEEESPPLQKESIPSPPPPRASVAKASATSVPPPPPPPPSRASQSSSAKEEESAAPMSAAAAARRRFEESSKGRAPPPPPSGFKKSSDRS